MNTNNSIYLWKFLTNVRVLLFNGLIKFGAINQFVCMSVKTKIRLQSIIFAECCMTTPVLWLCSQKKLVRSQSSSETRNGTRTGVVTSSTLRLQICLCNHCHCRVHKSNIAVSVSGLVLYLYHFSFFKWWLSVSEILNQLNVSLFLVIIPCNHY